VSVYNLRDANGVVLAVPEIKTVYGCTFVQLARLGHASYHFESEDNCYICYANAPAVWLLDDGTPPPERKPWEDASYDPGAYTFRGTVRWDPAFNGDSRCDYEIVFAEDFSGVVGGQVVATSSRGKTKITRFIAPWEANPDHSLLYIRWTPPPSTIFGNVYVQGLSYSPSLEGVASYHFNSESDCYISYSKAPEAWRLEDGSAPPKKKPFVDVHYNAIARTFRGSVEWDPSCGGACSGNTRSSSPKTYLAFVKGTCVFMVQAESRFVNIASGIRRRACGSKTCSTTC